MARLALAGAALAILGAGPAPAQIVPETSGKTSAANSPAAVVQTGSRKRLSCFVCAAEPGEPPRGDARRPRHSGQY
ncbi:hypothetical protein U8607_06275 [Methylobacterium durans]|uniref:hypothetical protein n=1 Tax=Methylobacterium durans TaxID=2202825 RepID=UPI002AFE1244|nr:hypothetical protein [Methylobacterium durans]MEA1831687.1 hypothetical protein [Methylobacterium durans]